VREASDRDANCTASPFSPFPHSCPPSCLLDLSSSLDVQSTAAPGRPAMIRMPRAAFEEPDKLRTVDFRMRGSSVELSVESTSWKCRSDQRAAFERRASRDRVIARCHLRHAAKFRAERSRLSSTVCLPSVPMMRFGSAIKAPRVTLITRSSHRRSSFNIASTSLGAGNEMHVFGHVFVTSIGERLQLDVSRSSGSDYRRVCAFSNARLSPIKTILPPSPVR